MQFINGNIFRDGAFHPGSFRVEDGRFAAFDEPAGPGAIDLQGARVIPGLVDIHSHGNSGADFSDGDYDGLCRMAEYYAQNGVTSFAPASMTLPLEELSRVYTVGAKLAAEGSAHGARLMGFHMEGPFFSPNKCGAQNPLYLRQPDFEGFRALQNACGGLIRIADIAPELPGATDFIRQAKELCTVSLAHTEADYDCAAAAFDAGAAHVTHLFNAMPSIHHRKPGVIGAAAERDNIIAELICDGLHIHESIVRMAFRLFPGRICLISDSLRCCGMPDGEYELTGQTVYLKDGVARLSDGTIAGSATNLFDCMRKAISFGIPVEQAVASASIIPAQEIGRSDEIGSIAPGKLADFVVCSEAMERLAVYIGGVPIQNP